MSGSNYCFLTCMQISREASKVVWYSHLLKNFPQFVVIHTIKDNLISYYKILWLTEKILILKANWKMRGFIWFQYLHSFFTLKSSEHSPVGQWKSSSDTFILRASTTWHCGGQRRWNVRKRKPSDHKSLNCVWSEISPCTYHTIPGCHWGWTMFKRGTWAK